MEITEPRNFFLIVGCVIAALIIVRDESQENLSSRPTPTAVVVTGPEPAFTKAEFDQALQKHLWSSKVPDCWQEVEVLEADAADKKISLQIWYTRFPEYPEQTDKPVAMDTGTLVRLAIYTLTNDFDEGLYPLDYSIVCRGGSQKGGEKEYYGKSVFDYRDDSIQFSKNTNTLNL